MDREEDNQESPSSPCANPILGSHRYSLGQSYSFRGQHSPRLEGRLGQPPRLYQSTRDLTQGLNPSSRSSSNSSLYSSRTHSNHNISSLHSNSHLPTSRENNRSITVATSNSTSASVQENQTNNNNGIPQLSRNSFSYQTLNDPANRNALESLANQLTHNEPESDHYLYARGSGSTQTFRSALHASQTLAKFRDLRQKNQLCDVILELNENRQFPAHRNILASSSPYFYAMFTGPMSESRSASVFLHDINADAFEKILEFIYSGELVITDENVQSILPVANHLQMNSVKEACCDFLQTKILPTNCLGIQRFADIHACPQLLKFTKKFTEQHFGEILEQGDEYLDLSKDQLHDIISSDELCVSEEKIFHAVTRWIRHDPKSRAKCAGELFACVRFALHPKEKLVDLTQSEKFLKENPWCKDYLIEALGFHLQTWSKKQSLNDIRVKPRTPCAAPMNLVVIGGQAPKAIKWVQSFSFVNNSWTTNTLASSSSLAGILQTPEDPAESPGVSSPVSTKAVYNFPDLPSRRSRCGVAVIGNFIYVVGGFNGALRLRSMEIYDIHRQTWTSGPNMEIRRSTLGVTSLNGKVYAIGGFDGVNGFKSAEVYDPSTESWAPIASMNIRRSSVCCVALNNRIFALGGYDGVFRRCLSTVETYNPVANEWSVFNNMLTRRSGACAATLNNKIYVIGGHDGPLVWNTCECYNLETNLWTKVADLNVKRRNAGSIVYQDRIFVVGGDDGNSNLTSVEFYDPNENIWRLLPCPMPHGVCYAGTVLVNLPYLF